MGGKAHFIPQIVQKFYYNLETSEVFKDLHHGDYNAISIPEIDGMPIIDTFLVENIISLNYFGSPRTSQHMLRSSGDNDEKETSDSTCGIWTLASRINHSCVNNCYRTFIGDMQIIRAYQDLEANIELRYSYWNTPLGATYEEAQARCKNWGFTCDCSLCLDMKSTPEKTLQKRKDLNSDLDSVIKGPRSNAQIWRAQGLLKQLENTYPTSSTPLRFELAESYYWLGFALIEEGKLTKALEMHINGLEALGFKVIACPPRKDTKKPKFEIQRWGMPNDSTFVAFLSISDTYKTLEPELCEAAKHYAETAYSICIGESDTVHEFRPGATLTPK
ncbi:hypothetical protein AAE478_006439 [Parahypoxylon ruwenzoriense]